MLMLLYGSLPLSKTTIAPAPNAPPSINPTSGKDHITHTPLAVSKHRTRENRDYVSTSLDPSSNGVSILTYRTMSPGMRRRWFAPRCAEIYPRHVPSPLSAHSPELSVLNAKAIRRVNQV